MKQRTTLAVLAAFIGAVALYRGFGRYDQAAHLGQFQLSRAQALAKAREVVRRQGYEAAGWTPAVQIVNPRGSSWIQRWLQQHPQQSVFRSLVTPYNIQVTLQQPDGGRFTGVTLSPDGRVVGFGTATRQAVGAEHMHHAEPLDKKADTVLQEYLGERARLFRPVNRGVAQSHRVLYSWEYNDPADSPHLVRFEASFSDEKLVLAELTAEPADSFLTEVRRLQASDGYLVTYVATAMFVSISLAFPFFFRALVRHRLSGRRLLTMTAFALGLVMVGLWGGPWLDQARAEAARDFGTVLESLTSQSALFFGVVVWWVLFYGAGRAVLRREQMEQWCSLEALLDRRIGEQGVGAAIFHGVLCGVFLAALPLLVAPLTPAGTWTTLTSIPSLFFPSAVAADLLPTLLVEVVGLVLFLIPLLRRLRWNWLATVLFVMLAAPIWEALHPPFDEAPAWSMGVSALTCAVLWVVETEFGALAALAAGGFTLTTWAACGYLVQPQPELQAQAWWAMAPFAGAALGGAAMMRFGRYVEPEAAVAAMEAESSNEVQSQRERLASEFSVARRAQQAMLPPVPEQLGGATLAALCEPARDVGGDLYDFYPTIDGRYALAVADVSGKGVPASLYMTLTKGYLAGAGRESTDLRGTLSDLNLHLLAAGKRKIFVTMALSYFSPETRCVELARAGHNSPLWRRAELGRSEYLTPPGMGLGLTSRLLFERALRPERYELAPGDAFVLYSDGITEAMNEAREQFGEDRLQGVVDACDGLTAEATRDAILKAVKDFIGTAPPHDDMTLFVMRV